MPEIVQALTTALMQHQRKPDMGGKEKRLPNRRLVRFWARTGKRKARAGRGG